MPPRAAARRRRRCARWCRATSPPATCMTAASNFRWKKPPWRRPAVEWQPNLCRRTGRGGPATRPGAVATRLAAAPAYAADAATRKVLAGLLDHHFDAAVLRPASRRVVRGNRMRIAAAFRRNDVGIDALGDEVPDDLVGPLRREVEIVGDTLGLQRFADRTIVGVAI